MMGNQLMAEVAAQSGLTKKDAGKALQAIFAVITREITSGGSVMIKGFGVFETHKRAASKAKNFHTGEIVGIDAVVKPRFRAGKLLKNAVKTGKMPEPATGLYYNMREEVNLCPQR
jgi:DNA-binding protein HU-beta